VPAFRFDRRARQGRARPIVSDLTQLQWEVGVGGGCLSLSLSLSHALSLHSPSPFLFPIARFVFCHADVSMESVMDLSPSTLFGDSVLALLTLALLAMIFIPYALLYRILYVSRAIFIAPRKMLRLPGESSDSRENLVYTEVNDIDFISSN